MATTTEIKVSKRKLELIFSDNIKSAEAINLVHVSDSEEGITRQRKDDDFIYLLKGIQVSEEKILSRIRSLVLPPAWEQVWICTRENGHLQATGLDAKHRKQYKYHPLWNSLRNQTKFHHLYEFGKALPAIRQQLQKDLLRAGLSQEKVLATVISIMQCTCIRVGNSQYEKLYGSFGLTTLKDKHVAINGSKVKFTFTGKKGIHQDIGLKSRRLANIIRQCRDIPGKELFQYYDDNGQRHPVDSGMVNNYIKAVSGGQFTAKDFRTWAGTLHAIEVLKDMAPANTAAEIKKNIVMTLDSVARQLGNTRTVCKKYYVHPRVLDLYANQTLEKFIASSDSINCTGDTGLSEEEETLMNILSDRSITAIAV